MSHRRLLFACFFLLRQQQGDLHETVLQCAKITAHSVNGLNKENGKIMAPIC